MLFVAAQLLVLRRKLVDALLLGARRLADAGAACCLLIGLGQPPPHGRLTQLQVAADLAHAQALPANHLHDLQFEFRGECPSLSTAHVPRPSGDHLLRCSGKLDHHSTSHMTRAGYRHLGVEKTSPMTLLSVASSLEIGSGLFAEVLAHAALHHRFCASAVALRWRVSLVVAIRHANGAADRRSLVEDWLNRLVRNP